MHSMMYRFLDRSWCKPHAASWQRGDRDDYTWLRCQSGQPTAHEQAIGVGSGIERT